MRFKYVRHVEARILQMELKHSLTLPPSPLHNHDWRMLTGNSKLDFLVVTQSTRPHPYQKETCKDAVHGERLRKSQTNQHLETDLLSPTRGVFKVLLNTPLILAQTRWYSINHLYTATPTVFFFTQQWFKSTVQCHCPITPLNYKGPAQANVVARTCETHRCFHKSPKFVLSYFHEMKATKQNSSIHRILNDPCIQSLMHHLWFSQIKSEVQLRYGSRDVANLFSHATCLDEPTTTYEGAPPMAEGGSFSSRLPPSGWFTLTRDTAFTSPGSLSSPLSLLIFDLITQSQVLTPHTVLMYAQPLIHGVLRHTPRTICSNTCH